MECLSPNPSNVLTTRKCAKLILDAEEERKHSRRHCWAKPAVDVEEQPEIRTENINSYTYWNYCVGRRGGWENAASL